MTFLWNKAGNPEPKTKESIFKDIHTKDWYYKAVLWAAENGIASGYEEADGTYTFRPNAVCTRAHVVQFLWNAAGNPKASNINLQFKDVAQDAWYYNAVLWAAQNKITVGYEETDGTYTFRPENNCTRAEIVQLLYMAYKK